MIGQETGHGLFDEPEHTSLDVIANASTWVLLIIMGVAYTVGSFAFVRAFDDPPKQVPFPGHA